MASAALSSNAGGPSPSNAPGAPNAPDAAGSPDAPGAPDAAGAPEAPGTTDAASQFVAWLRTSYWGQKLIGLVISAGTATEVPEAA